MIPPRSGAGPGARPPNRQSPSPSGPRAQDFVSCYEAGTGRSPGSQGCAQARAPFMPGPLGSALCLPQSAPRTKVARQVPGRRQRSRSGSAWLPGAEAEGAGHPEREVKGVMSERGVQGFSHPGSFWCLEPPSPPAGPWAEQWNWISNSKGTLNPRVPHRKANVAGHTGNIHYV